jgi:hypothetical protein
MYDVLEKMYVCTGAKVANIELLEWLYTHLKIDNCQILMCVKATQNGHVNVLEWIRAKYYEN